MAVVSIEFEKANGDTVETLPTERRVDFAHLVEVTEFVTAATIPNGTYVAATVRLDYTEAAVTVELDGLPTEAVVVDENGDALGEVDLELQLDDGSRPGSEIPKLTMTAVDDGGRWNRARRGRDDRVARSTRGARA